MTEPAESAPLSPMERWERSYNAINRRTPEAEAQIAAAHAPPDAMEVAMQTGIDDALEERAREIRSCAHAIFHAGCASCEERSANDSRGARKVMTRSARVKWDAEVAAVHLAHPAPDPTEEMAKRAFTAACGDAGPVFAVDQPKEPSIVLTGADMAAFDEFALAAAALEAHAEQTQALQQRYQAALQVVSHMAARRNRGK